MNEDLEDKLLVQSLSYTRLNLLKEIIEWYGEADFGPTKQKILYKNNDTNCEFVSNQLYDDTSIVEMIKNHLTNGRTSINPGDYTGEGVSAIEPVVVPYRSPDGKWDIDKSVNWITANSYNRYIKRLCGHCAKLVRMALEAGGMSTAGRPPWACQYTAFLPLKGFKHIETLVNRQQQMQFSSSKAQRGDIAVMSHGTYGHICMWNGNQWVSDFKQNNMWPYSGNGVCRIFRYEA